MFVSKKYLPISPQIVNKNIPKIDCQHYEDYIPNRNISRLIKSNDVEDKERLNFLIKNNLQGTINLLIKKEEKENNPFLNFNHKASTNTSQTASSNKYKKESIPRVSINRLFRNKKKYLNTHIIIWGNADIESKERESKNLTTEEKFTIKQLIFKVNDKFRFSISLSSKIHYTNVKSHKIHCYRVFFLVHYHKR